MTIVAVRDRAPLGLSYGGHAADMVAGSKMREDIRDRAAYVYVTGQFPSHLRSNTMAILRAITATLRQPVALDGRSGSIKVTSAVAADLELEAHPLVKGVRAKLAEGFLIQPSREMNARRPYSHVFMYRPGKNGIDLVVVTSEGAVKDSWD